MGNLTRLDDERVNRFIQWSQGEGKRYLLREGDGAPSIVRINEIAWHLLKEFIRGDRAHRYDNDFDAAAAEHYMYVRFLAGMTGDPACHVAPTVYAAKKVLDQIRGRLQAGQAQGGHPVLPSNPYVLAWGQKGVVDGLTDYKQESKGAPYRLGTAVAALAKFSRPANEAESIGRYAVKVGKAVPGYMK